MTPPMDEEAKGTASRQEPDEELPKKEDISARRPEKLLRSLIHSRELMNALEATLPVIKQIEKKAQPLDSINVLSRKFYILVSQLFASIKAAENWLISELSRNIDEKTFNDSKLF